MRDLEIVEAGEADAEEILGLYYRNSAELLGLTDIREMLEYDARVYGSNYKFLSLGNLIGWLRRRGSGSHVYVARLAGRVVGFVVFHAVGSAGYIEELHVGREWRGAGIGSALLAKAEEVLWRSGCRVIYLEANVEAYGFFERVGYVPVNVEEAPYMGRLQYVDMVKDREGRLRREVYEVIRSIKQGEYDHAINLLKDVEKRLRSALSPLKNVLGGEYPSRYNFINLLSTVARIHKEDNETQSYVPLYFKILNDYCSHASNLWRPLLHALALKILADGLTANAYYVKSLRRLGEALENLNTFYVELTLRGIPLTGGLTIIRDLTQSMLTWLSTLTLLSRIECGVLLGTASEAERVNAYRLVYEASSLLNPPLDEYRTEVRDYWERIRDILRNACGASARLSALRFNYRSLHYVGFIKILSNVDLSDKKTLGRLIDFLRSKFKDAEVRSGLKVSRDILSEGLRRYSESAKCLDIRDVSFKDPLEDGDGDKDGTLLTGSLGICILPNNIVMVEFKVKGGARSGIGVYDLYRLSRLFMSAGLEYNVVVKEREYFNAVEAEKFKADEPTLLLFIASLFKEFISTLGKEGFDRVIDNEAVGHVMFTLPNLSEEQVDELVKNPLIRNIHELQTLSIPPLAGSGDGQGSIGDEGCLISVASYPEDRIFTSRFLTLIVNNKMPQWVLEEVQELIRLALIYRASIYYIYHDMCRGTSMLREGERNYEEVMTCLKRLISLYYVLAASPAKARYYEYNTLYEQVSACLGTREYERDVEAYIDKYMNLLDMHASALQLEEIKLLRTFIEHEEREHKILDYIALLISIIGLGEIVWSIAQPLYNLSLLYKPVIYAVLTATGLTVLGLIRRSRGR